MKRNGVVMCRVVPFMTAFLVTAVLGSGFAEVRVSAAMDHSCALAGKKQTGYFRVALTGDGPAATEKKRATVNVALVLDHSGSMQGAKLENAKQAAINVLEMLMPEDIVSVVMYDDTISVLVPATKATNREMICAAIRNIREGNSTALYAGVVQGANEVRKFRTEESANRIVLLSDGLANVGPDTPEALGELGTSLGREGISVTTIGLGLDFNEDLMMRLAAKSDGNHMFAEQPSDVLTAFKDEFKDVTSVVAKNISINVTLDPRLHPLRGMGREVTINGQNVYAGLVQMYAGQTKYILFSVDMNPNETEESIQAGTVKVDYVNSLNSNVEHLETSATLSFTKSPETALASENKEIMECVVAVLATEENERAMALRDRGQLEQSRQALEKNAAYLQNNAARYNSEKLDSLGKTNADQAGKVMDNSSWKGLRKSMGKGQYDIKQQTSK